MKEIIYIIFGGYIVDGTVGYVVIVDVLVGVGYWGLGRNGNVPKADDVVKFSFDDELAILYYLYIEFGE